MATEQHDQAIVYERDGLIVYRASALGSSFKSLVAARLGYDAIDPPQKFVEIFQAGHDAEDPVLKQMVADGWHLYDQQKEVVLPITGKIAVIGHIDSKGYYGEQGRVVEVKSQSHEAWDSFVSAGWESGLFPKYRWQVSAYMLAEHLGLALVRTNRDTGEMAVSYTDEPFFSITDIRARILRVEAQAATGELPDDRTCNDYPCPYFYLHDRDDRIVLEDPQIEALAKEYKQAQRQEKTAKEKKQVTFTALKDACGDELRLATENGWKVTFYQQTNPFKPVVTHTALDTLRAGWASAVLEEYRVPVRSWRVRITEPEGAKDE